MAPGLPAVLMVFPESPYVNPHASSNAPCRCSVLGSRTAQYWSERYLSCEKLTSRCVKITPGYRKRSLHFLSRPMCLYTQSSNLVNLSVRRTSSLTDACTSTSRVRENVKIFFDNQVYGLANQTRFARITTPISPYS